MSNLTAASPQALTHPPAISLSELWPWALFAAVMLLLVFFVGVEEGAVSLNSGTFIHELVHDGRHLLGFPCH
jgi:Probable cobalt transporter subunit (CbtB)